MPLPAAAYDPIIAAVLAAQPAVVGVAEAAFVNVIAGALPAAAPAATPFSFPGNAAIRAELTNSPAKWPLVIQHHLDDFVLPQFHDIPATPVPGMPGGTAAAWNTPARIDQVLRKQGDVAAAIPATNDMGTAVVTQFDFKLRQLQGNPGDDIVNGWRLVQQYLNDDAVPAAAHSTRETAVQTINNLAAFEGFCIRLASAIGAADRAGVSLSEALALWRTEGDLLTPYSEPRRAAGAPACDVIPSISLGTATADVFVTMHRGLWGFTYNRLTTRPLPSSAVEKTAVEDDVKLAAFIYWSLVGAGVDFFWKQVPWGNRAATIDALCQFLNANHIARTGAPADLKTVLKAQCNAVLDDFMCTLPRDPTRRVVAAPRHPANLMSLILGEALIFAELSGSAGKGPVVTPTPKLKYLAYHCQDHRHPTDVTQDKFTLMLVSAGVAAAANAPDGPLKTSLAPYATDPQFPKSAGLKTPNFRTPLVTGDTSGHLRAYQKLAAGGWWTTANLEALADFMLTATSTQWHGWDDLRGNIARYQKLRAYYDALLT